METKRVLTDAKEAIKRIDASIAHEEAVIANLRAMRKELADDVTILTSGGVTEATPKTEE